MLLFIETLIPSDTSFDKRHQALGGLGRGDDRRRGEERTYVWMFPLRLTQTSSKFSLAAGRNRVGALDADAAAMDGGRDDDSQDRQRRGGQKGG